MHANSAMNFNAIRIHPSKDIHKLNGHVGFELGGWIGAGDKHCGVISIWIIFVAMGPPGSLGRELGQGQERGAQCEPGVLQHQQTDKRKSRGIEKELGLMCRKN